MSDGLVVPVPEEVAAVYLVPVDRKPNDLAPGIHRFIDQHVHPAHREMMHAYLDGPWSTIEVSTADARDLPIHVLRVMGAAPSELGALERAAYHVVLRGSFRPGWPPLHEWCCRAYAAAVAAHVAGPVLDLRAFRLSSADQLLDSLPDDTGFVRLTDYLRVPYSSSETGLRFTTLGLGRFGLPELQANNVPAQLESAWGKVMNGLANAVLRSWAAAVGHAEQPSFATLSEGLTVGADDLAQAHADPDYLGDGRAEVRLAYAPGLDGQDDFLDILPPLGHAASAGEFFASVCTEMFGAIDHPVRSPADPAAMDLAIAAARAGLVGVRRRFLAGELGLTGRLIVKHRLQVPGGNEYVWAFVTDWRQAGEIHGASANDAYGDERIRVGRPVVVDADDVVDWAIWVDGEIVEGGTTNDLLDG